MTVETSPVANWFITSIERENTGLKCMGLVQIVLPQAFHDTGAENFPKAIFIRWLPMRDQQWKALPTDCLCDQATRAGGTRHRPVDGDIAARDDNRPGPDHGRPARGVRM